MNISIRYSFFLLLVPAVSNAQETAPPSRFDHEAEVATVFPAYGYDVGSVPAAIVTNTRALFSRDNILPLLLGSGLTLIASTADDEAREQIAGEFDGVGSVGASMGRTVVFTSGMAALFTAGQIAPAGAFRRVTFDLAQGYGANLIVTGILKYSVKRDRPDSSNSLSFPSGHTSSFATAATVLWRHLGPRAGVPAALVATFVGFSRIEHDKHFLSDVVAGAVVGIIVGRSVTAHLTRGGDALRRTTFSLYPTGDGVGLHLRHSF